MARSSSKRQTAASSGSRRPTKRSGKEAASKMSLTGRRTCASASALNLDAQPAQAERVVSRISRPVCGMGINLLKQNDRQSSLIAGHFTLLSDYQLFITNYHQGVVVGSMGAMGVTGASGDVGSGKMNWLPLGIKTVCTPGESFRIY